MVGFSNFGGGGGACLLAGVDEVVLDLHKDLSILQNVVFVHDPNQEGTIGHMDARLQPQLLYMGRAKKFS